MLARFVMNERSGVMGAKVAERFYSFMTIILKGSFSNWFRVSWPCFAESWKSFM